MIRHSLLTLLFLLLTGCSLITGGNIEVPTPTPTKIVVVLTRVPTATNFPKIGTPTPAPPTATPLPTPTATRVGAVFDDDTLAELMAGTIAATGVDAEVAIIDERSSGGDRIAHITLVSQYNIDESDLLLKLFVLEVGSALRTLRAFREGTMDVDADATFVTVNNTSGELLGTVLAPTEEINAFLEGRSSVNETLNRLELTGVFETFKE